MTTLRSRPDESSDLVGFEPDDIVNVIAETFQNGLLSNQLPKYYSNAAEICLRTLVSAELIGDYTVMSVTPGNYSTEIELAFRMPDSTHEWFYLTVQV